VIPLSDDDSGVWWVTCLRSMASTDNPALEERCCAPPSHWPATTARRLSRPAGCLIRGQTMDAHRLAWGNQLGPVS
jgi:hypothetical protein